MRVTVSIAALLCASALAHAQTAPSCPALFADPAWTRLWDLDAPPADLRPIGAVTYGPAVDGLGAYVGAREYLLCTTHDECPDLKFSGGPMAQGMWIQAALAGTSGHETFMMSQSWASGEGMDLHLRDQQQGRVFACYMNGIRRAQSRLLWGAHGWPPDGAFHHAACVYTGVVNPVTGGEEVRVYIDGVDVTDVQVYTGNTAGWVEWPPQYPITGGSGATGHFSLGSPRVFQGAFDRAFRWDGPGYDAAAHYACEVGGVPPPPDPPPCECPEGK